MHSTLQVTAVLYIEALEMQLVSMYVCVCVCMCAGGGGGGGCVYGGVAAKTTTSLIIRYVRLNAMILRIIKTNVFKNPRIMIE